MATGAGAETGVLQPHWPRAATGTLTASAAIASPAADVRHPETREKLAERIKHGGFGHARIEGLPAADWVLIDAGDIVVHLFRPEVRSFYNLERMWAFGDAPVVAA